MTGRYQKWKYLRWLKSRTSNIHFWNENFAVTNFKPAADLLDFVFFYHLLEYDIVPLYV